MMSSIPVSRRVVHAMALCATLFAGIARGPAQSVYDPLAVNGAAPATLDLVVHDAQRTRDIPVLIYLPDDKQTPAPVVLFSHGLGGTRFGYDYLGPHWARRGYVTVCLQHAGSDDSVWRGKGLLEARRDMQAAANPQNLILRAEDVHAVLDQLTTWNAAADSPLKGRLDLARVGMSGHSFGAGTTLAVSGEVYPLAGNSFIDERVKAAVAMSPSPSRVTDNARAFGGIKIPFLLMTGTKDDSPFGDYKAASRLQVYDAMPAGEKYEVVLDRAEHGAFSDRALPAEHEPRNPNHHRAVLALGTAFWDAYLRDDPAARKWLAGDGPRTVLEAADRWEKK